MPPRSWREIVLIDGAPAGKGKTWSTGSSADIERRHLNKADGRRDLLPPEEAHAGQLTSLVTERADTVVGTVAGLRRRRRRALLRQRL